MRREARQLKSTLDVSIERRVNSKRQESSLTDRFIELRIVFPMAPGTNSTLRWPLGFSINHGSLEIESKHLGNSRAWTRGVDWLAGGCQPVHWGRRSPRAVRLLCAPGSRGRPDYGRTHQGSNHPGGIEFSRAFRRSSTFSSSGFRSGLRPRFFDRAFSDPLCAALRHVVRCDEYRPLAAGLDPPRRARCTGPLLRRSAACTTD